MLPFFHITSLPWHKSPMSLYQGLRPSTENRFPKPALLPTFVETSLDHGHQSLQCPQLPRCIPTLLQRLHSQSLYFPTHLQSGAMKQGPLQTPERMTTCFVPQQVLQAGSARTLPGGPALLTSKGHSKRAVWQAAELETGPSCVAQLCP